MKWVEHGVAEVVCARVSHVAIVAGPTNPLWPVDDDEDLDDNGGAADDNNAYDDKECLILQ